MMPKFPSGVRQSSPFIFCPRLSEAQVGYVARVSPKAFMSTTRIRGLSTTIPFGSLMRPGADENGESISSQFSGSGSVGVLVLSYAQMSFSTAGENSGRASGAVSEQAKAQTARGKSHFMLQK